MEFINFQQGIFLLWAKCHNRTGLSINFKNLGLLTFALFTTLIVDAQEIEVYDTFDDFESHLFTEDDRVYVVNFWATWCAPCIKELPHFDKVKENFENQNVEVVLVSIDFKKQYDRSLLPFLKRKKLQSRVIHMADPRSNIWVDKVDPEWSGAIPATLFVKNGDRLFLEREFESYDDLSVVLKEFIKS